MTEPYAAAGGGGDTDYWCRMQQSPCISGIDHVVEMDWWESGVITKEGQDGEELHLKIACTPAQHW